MRLDPEKVRRTRESLGYSIESVGEKGELSPNSVLRAEHGEEIRPSTARRLARALDTEVADLYPKADAPTSPLPAEKGEKRRGTELERWAEYIEGRARAREQQAATEENPFLTGWKEAVAWESEVTEEFFDLFEAAEKAARPYLESGAARRAAVQELERLEEAYTRVWAAQKMVGRLVGEVLDSFSKQHKDTRSLERRRLTRQRQEEERSAAFEEHRKRITA